MQITLNGKPRPINGATTLEGIIEQFCKDTRHVIAEVNGSIIKSQQWPEKTLQDGDTVELVNFVGGG